MNDDPIPTVLAPDTPSMPSREASPPLGAWYWVTGAENDPPLYCVVHVGSNHAYPVDNHHKIG